MGARTRLGLGRERYRLLEVPTTARPSIHIAAAARRDVEWWPL